MFLYGFAEHQKSGRPLLPAYDATLLGEFLVEQVDGSAMPEGFLQNSPDTVLIRKRGLSPISCQTLKLSPSGRSVRDSFS